MGNKSKTALAIDTRIVAVIIIAITLLVVILIVKHRRSQRATQDRDELSLTRDSSPTVVEGKTNTGTLIQPKQNERKRGGITKILLALVLVVAISLICFLHGYACIYSIKNNGEAITIVGRNANNNDIYVEGRVGALTGRVDLDIKPNVDITNLQITCKFYNSSGDNISTKVKNVGNVTKGNQFTISIQLSVTEILIMSNYTVKVTGGRVG